MVPSFSGDHEASSSLSMAGRRYQRGLWGRGRGTVANGRVKSCMTPRSALSGENHLGPVGRDKGVEIESTAAGDSTGCDEPGVTSKSWMPKRRHPPWNEKKPDAPLNTTGPSVPGKAAYAGDDNRAETPRAPTVATAALAPNRARAKVAQVGVGAVEANPFFCRGAAGPHPARRAIDRIVTECDPQG